MKSSHTTLFLSVGSALALATAQAAAGTSYVEAEVLSTTPIYHVVESSRPERQCWEEELVREVRQQPQARSATPGILGAVIGGAIGNAVGHKKRNRQVGTVVGAVLGGSIGSDISRNGGTARSVEYIDTVERCRTVHANYQEEKLVGYDVRYRYNGAQHVVRMPHDPGAVLRLRVDVEPVF
jgi:uncharacterized protein YcfJ